MSGLSKRKTPPAPLTLEECLRIKRAIWKTFNYIADDCEGMSDNEVLVIALDADRVLQIGEPQTTEWLEFYKRFIRLPDKVLFAIAKMRLDAKEVPREVKHGA
jgi:hypothetical protein